MSTQNTKTSAYEVRAFIERKFDGSFYGGTNEKTKEQIWNKKGCSFPAWHSAVYLAKIQPEHFTVHYITQEII